MKSVKPMVVNVAGHTVTIRGFAITAATLVSDQIEENLASGSLARCYGCWVEKQLLLRSAAVDQTTTADQLYRVIESLQGEETQRVVVAQLARVDDEDAVIARQHCEFLLKEARFGFKGTFAHHPLPTEPLRYQRLEERLFNASLNDFHHLEWLLSCEALACYGLWIAEELDKRLALFTQGQTELYPLEGAITDLIHALRSPFIKTVRQQIGEKLLSGNDALANIEKHWVPLWKELATTLEEIIPLLDAAIEAYDFAGRHNVALLNEVSLLTIYRQLLTNREAGWAERWLQQLFLWFELNAVVALNSLHGTGRSNIAFAAAVAAAQMWQVTPKHQMLDLFINWNEAAESDLGQQLREDVLAILLASGQEGENFPSGRCWNREMLSLLPLQVGKDDPIINAGGLTNRGMKLLGRLFHT